MNGHQIRMARAAVQWGVRELAERAETTPNTISRIENGGDALAGTLERIQRALEVGGVVFLPDDPAGDGVRYKAPAKAPKRSRSAKVRR